MTVGVPKLEIYVLPPFIISAAMGISSLVLWVSGYPFAGATAFGSFTVLISVSLLNLYCYIKG